MKIFVLLSLFIFLGCATAPPQTPESRETQETQKVDPVEAPETDPQTATSRSKEIGKKFIQAALKEFTFVRNEEVISAVNRVGREILESIGVDPEKFHFLVIHQNQLNAFAIPGGYIFVFDGLLKNLGSVDALAGVLAHEIAHVQRNHFFKDSKKLNAINLATMASIILAGLAGEGAGATGTIAMAANVSFQLKFSRANEEEADFYAIRYLKKTPYNPAGLAEFFKTLAFYERFTRNSIPTYLSTHPGVHDRRFRVESALKDFSGPSGPSSEDQSPIDWRRISAILHSSEEGRSSFSGSQKEGKKATEAQSYLAGLRALHSGQFQEALEFYQTAIQLNPNESIYYADLSEVYMRLQKADLAKEAALKSIGLSDENALPYLVLGMIAQAEEDHDGAVKQLEKAGSIAPNYPLVHLQLARSHHALLQPGKEHFHLGRYHRLNFEPEKAMRQFRAGKKKVEAGSPLSEKISAEMVEIVREGL